MEGSSDNSILKEGKEGAAFYDVRLQLRASAVEGPEGETTGKVRRKKEMDCSI